MVERSIRLSDGSLRIVLLEFESPSLPVHIIHLEGRGNAESPSVS